MTKLWDDLFTSYRRYKWMDVDSPQYEPLENEVVSKEDIKKLKAKEYNEKNKDKQKIKRLQKIVDNLRAENKTLKENPTLWEFAWMKVKVMQPEEKDILMHKIEVLEEEVERKEDEFEELKKALKVLVKYL